MDLFIDKKYKYVISKIQKVPMDIQGINREKTRQVRENWSQQLEHKQGTEPGV